MVSYSNTSYTNDFFDLSGVYFNSTSQSSSSAVDLDELDKRYLLKSGGYISNNLVINGSLDVKTNITLPDIGDVEDTIQGKQDEINDGDLTIAKTSGLQTALDNKYNDTGGTVNGNVSITGGLLVGTTNIIDEIGTKQDEINDGDLTIAKTSGLQTALDNKYNDTGGTVNGNVNITGDLVIGTTNIIDEIGTKQDEINDGDLTIAKTSGLQTALDDKQDTISNFEINGNVNLNTSGTNFDTIVVRRPTNVTGITDDYLIDLNELQIWVNDANILVENASSLISSVVSWSNKDIDLGSQKSPTNLYNGDMSGDNGVLTLNPSPTDIAIIIKNIPTTKINDIHAVQVLNNTSATLGNRAIGLAIELYNSKNDTDLTTILAQSNEISVMDSVYRFDFPSIDTYTLVFNSGGILPNIGAYVNYVTLEVVTPFSFPFNVIGNIDVSGSLTLPTIGDVEDAILGKEPTIQDNGLTIAKTSGLQTALDAKQATIDEDTDLSSNSLTTTDLVVNESLNIDNVITYEKYKQFNSLVIRRLDETDFETINLNEIQVWVGGVNIMVLDTNTLTSYFANWSEKDTPITAQRATEGIYNNIIESGSEFGTHSAGTSTNALIIKDIPLTFINDIQAIVLYNRTNASVRAIGLIIELYNNVDDPSLIEPLTTTNPITVTTNIFRFDFPAIDTYPADDFTDGSSITNIISETSAETEDAIINDIDTDVYINSNVNITGNLIVGTTNIITELGTKQPTITSATDLTSNLLTTNNLTINNSLSVDTRKYFDTIVLRRPTGITGEAGDFYIALRELQVWINGSNVLQSSGLTSLFANWAVDKEVDLGALGGGSLNDTSKLYDNVISNEYDAHSKEDNSTADIAIIIKGLSLTLIETIQALVLYNRTGDFNNTTIGIAIELYNSTQDPTFTEILATTSVITTAVDVYRFDFPDIATYTGFATGESLTNIILEEDATSEVVSVVGSPTEMEGGLSVDTITTTGNVDISGILMVEEVNVKGSLSSVQTQVDALIDLFGGGVNFRAYTLSSATFSAGNILIYDNESYDTENSYDTSTGIYTIVIAGTYVFTLGWYVVSGSTAVVNLIRKRNSVESILQQSTNGTNTIESGFFITTIAECETGDEIYAYLDSGACRLIPNDITDPTTLTSFSGSRISS
jgi:hypothetical protein